MLFYAHKEGKKIFSENVELDVFDIEDAGVKMEKHPKIKATIA